MGRAKGHSAFYFTLAPLCGTITRRDEGSEQREVTTSAGKARGSSLKFLQVLKKNAKDLEPQEDKSGLGSKNGKGAAWIRIN